MNKIAIVQCADYQQDNVDRTVRESLNLLDGIERYVRPGTRVLIKPNLVTDRRPDEAVTTHPAVVANRQRSCVYFCGGGSRQRIVYFSSYFSASL
jgi:uncharacterized protein (DUF362 family)